MKTNDINVDLRALRKLHKLTLAELAKKTGFSISYLSDLERGRVRPSLESLDRIVAAYKMEVEITFVYKRQYV